MGYAAVKYADLKNARLTNYKFSFDDMLALKGNTAVYVLYAHARIAGIVRNAGVDVDGAPPCLRRWQCALCITHIDTLTNLGAALLLLLFVMWGAPDSVALLDCRQPQRIAARRDADVTISSEHSPREDGQRHIDE